MARRRIIIEEFQGYKQDEISGILITCELIVGLVGTPDKQIRYLLSNDEIKVSHLETEELIKDTIHELIKAMERDNSERRTKS